MSHSVSPKEFIDSVISEKRKELRAFEGLKWELTRKEDTISSQEKLIEYLLKSVRSLSTDEFVNRFIDDNISYDFKNVKGLDLTVIYKEYCSWLSSTSYPRRDDETRTPKSMEYIKNYLDHMFKPSLCGRSEPFYVVYFGTSFKVHGLPSTGKYSD